LRKWTNFSTTINKLKELDTAICGFPDYREMYSKNILLELYRLAHRQFPWQRKPNSRRLVRYFKIFGHADVAPILLRKIGLTPKELYTLGLSFTGMFLDMFGMEDPIKIEIPGLVQDHVDFFLGHFSIELAAIKEKIAAAQSYDQDYVYAMNPLKIYPLVWVTLRNKRTLIAPVPTYLLNRFTEGVYYEICDAEGFSAAFGNSFQEYIGEVLAAANKARKSVILSEREYHVGKELKHSVDWILADESGTLFIECKTKKIRYAAKIGLATTEVLDEDLEKMAGFVVQTYKTLIDAKNRAYEHWQPNEQTLYPVIVTLEDWYTFGDRIVKAIDDRILDALAKAKIPESILQTNPYTICSADEFELAAEIIGQVGIQKFMLKKVDNEHRYWSLGAYMPNYFRDEMKSVGNLFPDAERAIHPSL
jgi:hypothetical protein